MERRRQVVALAGDRDVVFLHGLQQGRLGARRGPVDLVGHQQLGEDRTLHVSERAPAGLVLVHHLGADDVRRHQVRRELDAPRVEAERDAERLDELGLGKARNADQQGMTTGHDRHERLFHDALLSEDHPPDGGFHTGDVGEGRFGLRDDFVVAERRHFRAHHRHRLALRVPAKGFMPAASCPVSSCRIASRADRRGRGCFVVAVDGGTARLARAVPGNPEIAPSKRSSSPVGRFEPTR